MSKSESENTRTCFGFTGTRNGLNNNQTKKIIKLLKKYKNIEVHHGDCIGADTDFHNLCVDLSKNIKIVIHPPINESMRYYNNSKYIKKPKDYIKRNHDIVDIADILIACPISEEEVLRSGTWSTIRYARKFNKKVLLFV
jgi:hypothetical protein